MHAILLLVLAAPYELPAGDPIPAPSGALRVRIEAQLAALRDTDAIEAARAVRALALIGEQALPSVVKRINAAEAGERVLLLAAMSKVPRAAPLMVHARGDPSPTVRAWVTLPKRPRDPPLAELAKRYLRVLSIAEKTRSDEAQKDIAGKQWVGPEGEAIDLARVERRPAFERARENTRERMEDRTLAMEVHRQRLEAALDFARAGARELRSGAWNASMEDPLFVTYLALLREETSAFHVAAEAVVRLGAAGAPMIESLLHDDTFEARTLLMMLRQMRTDGGRGLFAATWRTEVRRALYDMAREVLPEAEVRALARSGAIDEEPTIRKAGLDMLLSFDAPEGRDLARGLLDPAKYGQVEFKRAAKLLARARQADDLKLLEEMATLVVLRDGTRKSPRMAFLRPAAARALTEHAGPETAAIAARFAASPDPRLRSLGIDMMVDPEALAKHLASETVGGARAQTAARLWTLGGSKYTELLAGEIRRDASSRARASLVRSLRRQNAVAPLVALVSDENSDVRAVVLEALSDLDHIDGVHAAALLAAHKSATDAGERQLALAALLPLPKNAEVQKRFALLGEAAFEFLSDRARGGHRIPFSVPLLPFLEGADHARRLGLEQVANAMPECEPGFFFALLESWERAFAAGGSTDDLAEGSRGVRARLMDSMAFSGDAKSAKLMLESLLTGPQEDPTGIIGGFKVVARLLPGPDLAPVVKPLREIVQKEYALEDKVAPQFHAGRHAFLRGACYALGWSGCEAGLVPLAEILLDPKLQDSEYEDGDAPALWWEALNALRLYPRAKVDAAFRRALAASEATGDLAKLEPGYLFDLAMECRLRRDRGRNLAEVELALTELLQRLPWEDDVPHEHMIALSNLGRNREAADAARARVEYRRRLGFHDDEGYWSSRRMEGRVDLFLALAEKSKSKFAEAAEKWKDDSLLCWLTSRYLLLNNLELDLAAKCAQRAVRLTGGVQHLQRDALAGVLLEQGRAEDALRWLDLDGELPVRRSSPTRWYLYYEAKARALIGDESGAGFALESALAKDRRLVGYAKRDPVLKRFGEAMKRAEEEWFHTLFSLN